ncbi:tryptophan 7-halogenase [Sphingomonas japonica]|uniref:Tryptophan halogenase n=1 Tax=Sphingomonas japonica TaxID=511662 RepID=A0ABX0TYH9_9SPHN|nr:tryptophan 7-halogenase [Sphingomonas japonica]NIJ22885.1 tryptophan halogenase [Sphingomonas japonica]
MPPDAGLPARIVVAGSGIVALSAALMLRRIVPGAAILLIETPFDPDALTDRTSRLWPIADSFHTRIGLDPAALPRDTAASVHSADRFERWGSDPAWLLPTDAQAIDGTLFQHWLRAGAGPLAALAPEAALAQSDLVVRTLPHLRIDPASYRALLSRGIDGARIARRALADFGVERAASGSVAAVIGGGDRIEADWFVDATGAAARIAGLVAPAHATVPTACDLIAYGRDEAPRGSAIDRWSGTPGGWIARIPGPRASTTMMGFASALTDPADAARRFRTETGAAPQHVASFTMTRRDSWSGNVLALGEAAVGIDVIGGLGLALTHSAMVHLAELLPGRVPAPIETAEFNRRTRAEFDAAADYVALHYRAPRDGSFWERARTLPVSDDLDRLLDQFARHARIPHRDDNPVPDATWRVLLAGIGVLPRHADAITRSQPLVRSQHVLAQAQQRVDLARRDATPYRAWHDLQLGRSA